MNNCRARALHRNMGIKLLYARLEGYQNERLNNSNYIFLQFCIMYARLVLYLNISMPNIKSNIRFTKIYKSTNQFSNIAQWLCAREYIKGNIGL